MEVMGKKMIEEELYILCPAFSLWQYFVIESFLVVY